MLGLVDYGSESEGSESHESGDEDATGKEVVEGSSLLSLPAARTPNGRGDNDVLEHDIEDIAKPKKWEKKLAEKARRKLEKKTAKRAEKERRKAEKREKRTAENGSSKMEPEVKKKRGPVKIAAFGGLSKAATERKEEEEDRPLPASEPTAPASHSLFSILPAPKTSGRVAPTSKTTTILLPHSLRAKASASKPKPIRPVVSTVDSSGEEDEGVDFFGLSSTDSSSRHSSIQFGTTSSGVGVPIMPTHGLSAEAGPARPLPFEGSSYGYENPLEEDQEAGTSSDHAANIKSISNEQAQELIFKHDYAPWGMDRRAMSDADIIDVSVDKAIGPNVHENLLKNLNHATIARASLPNIPKAADVKDRNAKRKHQITYLANLAVAREEALQQKWAEGKQAKKMARQKYGF